MYGKGFLFRQTFHVRGNPKNCPARDPWFAGQNSSKTLIFWSLAVAGSNPHWHCPLIAQVLKIMTTPCEWGSDSQTQLLLLQLTAEIWENAGNQWSVT